MKTEVYSWRLSARKKAELESEARREGKSIARVLDEITADWLEARRDSRNGDEAEQAEIRKRAAKVIGSLRGGNPDRSSQASQRIQEFLSERYGRNSAH